MDVDTSARAVNYMNRPIAFKRNARPQNIRNLFKQQRLFNTIVQPNEFYDETRVENDYRGDCNEIEFENDYPAQLEEKNEEDSQNCENEINFMTGASLPAFHT